jgi:EPS-associated MarR family transcriptional regulator
VSDYQAATPMQEDNHYNLLRILETQPNISQRQLAGQLDISLGKVNYCLKALLAKGWVKARNFKNSQNKWAYAYLLTPQGIEQKARLAGQFLQCKLAEYELLKQEIERLEVEVKGRK